MAELPITDHGEYLLPPRLDITVAHVARVHDYWRGGKDNFTADRVAAEEVIAVRPTVVHDVRANRAFLGRAVRFLAGDAGIRQFLDIGTGIPAAGNTHEVAQSIAPECRIVYVDNDPIVLAHARALLSSSPDCACASRCRRPGVPTRRPFASSTACASSGRAWRNATGGGPTRRPPGCRRTYPATAASRAGGNPGYVGREARAPHQAAERSAGSAAAGVNVIQSVRRRLGGCPCWPSCR